MKDAENKKILRTNIKKLRKKQNWTQAQLAEAVSVEPKHISCIESGLSFPSFDLISRFAQCFNIEMYELFLFDKKPSSTELKEKMAEKIQDFPVEILEKIYLYCKYIEL